MKTKPSSRTPLVNSTVNTVDAKHIFLDIVNYTYGRSIEAQTELISILNVIVKQSIRKNKIKRTEIIYIPTGDGMCISLINKTNPYDIHILISLDILSFLQAHNDSIKDEMRKFAIRIGINENTDNIVKDINNQINISGSGINFASRILGLCDGNQILVGNTVFEKLVQREKYIHSFTSYTGEVKHNMSLKVYQYKNSAFNYLNSDIPTIFRPQLKAHLSMPELVAYYICNCILNEDFISQKIIQPQGKYSLKIMMLYLSEDTLEKNKATKSKPNYRIKIEIDPLEYFNYLQSSKFWPISDLALLIVNNILSDFADCFTEEFLFVSETGVRKVKDEHPLIYKRITGK